MRFIVVCGNPECREEYFAQTEDRQWTCTKCGRVKANDFWPFLDARLMQATIDTDTDWKKMHDQLILKARQMMEDKDEEIKLLKKDIVELRNQLDAERTSGG
jgi:hypothetical protein